MKTSNEAQVVRNADIFQEVEALVSQLASAEHAMENGYAHLGYLLNTIHENDLWRGTFESFGQYVLQLAEKYNKGRTQLYHYFSTVRALKPYVSEEQMGAMGISKAATLASAAKVGNPPTAAVIEQAILPEVTAKDLRKTLFSAVNEPGEWMDLSFNTSEEKAGTIRDAIEAAKRTDPVIPADIKESQQIAEALYRMAMEYLGAHSTEVV